MKVVFLDRDGIINKKIENGYVLDWKDFQFLPDVAKAIKRLNQNDIPVFIATNQSAVRRGLLAPNELHNIHAKMQEILREQGAMINDIFVCPHRPDENCDCRKPKSGLFEQAKKKYNKIEFNHSWFIGDSESDVAAGKEIGCHTVLFKKGDNLKTVVEQIIKEINQNA